MDLSIFGIVIMANYYMLFEQKLYCICIGTWYMVCKTTEQLMN